MAAERGLVDAVIDPADTRREVAAAFELLATKRERLVRRKHDNSPAVGRDAGLRPVASRASGDRGREHHDHRQPHRGIVEVPIVDGGVDAAEWRKLLPGRLVLRPGADDHGRRRRAPITDLDGENGILRYRGYPIEQLAEQSTYLEVAYLLIHGELPDRGAVRAWKHDITYHTFIHENVRKRFMEGFHYDAHPMGMLVSAIAALSTFYPEAKDIHDPEIRYKQIVRLIAKMPTLAAACHRFSVGHAVRLPRQLARASRELPVDDLEGDGDVPASAPAKASTRSRSSASLPSCSAAGRR